MKIDIPKLTILPDRGVGPFCYGDDESILVDKYRLSIIRDGVCDVLEWRTYEGFEGAVRLYFGMEGEPPGLNGVGCFKTAWYCGTDLIGSDRNTIWDMLGQPDEVEVLDCDGRTSLEYYDLGLQVWLDNTSRCASIMCGPVIGDE